MKGLIPQPLKGKDLGPLLSGDLSKEQHIHHVAHLQHRATSRPAFCPAFCSRYGAEERAVSSSRSEAATDGDVPALEWLLQHFLQERRSARSVISHSLLHLPLLPALSLLDGLFWR